MSACVRALYFVLWQRYSSDGMDMYILSLMTLSAWQTVLASDKSFLVNKSLKTRRGDVSWTSIFTFDIQHN